MTVLRQRHIPTSKDSMLRKNKEDEESGDDEVPLIVPRRREESNKKKVATTWSPLTSIVMLALVVGMGIGTYVAIKMGEMRSFYGLSFCREGYFAFVTYRPTQRRLPLCRVKVVFFSRWRCLFSIESSTTRSSPLLLLLVWVIRVTWHKNNKKCRVLSPAKSRDVLWLCEAYPGKVFGIEHRHVIVIDSRGCCSSWSSTRLFIIDRVRAFDNQVVLHVWTCFHRNTHLSFFVSIW